MGLEHVFSGKVSPRFIKHVSSCLRRLRRRSSFIPDMGYDTRVYSASKFVRALLGQWSTIPERIYKGK
ncbi:hypothetical protein ACF0H5_015229 [Mactra antiquata]